MKENKVILKDQRILLLFVIFAIIACVTVINPKFITIKNIVTILGQISVIGVLTMAMSMLLISGGIDLSLGNIMALSSVVMAALLAMGQNIIIVIFGGIITGLICGLLNGFIIAKSKCIPLIITLGTSQIFYGLSLTISKGRIMSFSGVFDVLSKTKFFGVFPAMLIVLIIMIILAYILMNRTIIGKRLMAVGGNEKNAYLCGIEIDKYKILIYSLSGIFCSVAAIVFSARIDSVTANAGLGYETSALTAAIIGGVTFEGGKGSIAGAFLGCILMGVISNAMNILQVETYIQTIITGIIIAAAVVFSNVASIRGRKC
nr:ABC transporter permease [uncultured Lachnoanaerobaculum sp.]